MLENQLELMYEEKKELKFHEDKRKYLDNISQFIQNQDVEGSRILLDRYIKKYGPGGINRVELLSSNIKWLIRDMVNIYVPYLSEWTKEK